MLEVDLELPLAWLEAAATPLDREALWWEAGLILAVIQSAEGAPSRDGDLEPTLSRGLDRLEAKLDLLLLLLARASPQPGTSARPSKLILRPSELICQGDIPLQPNQEGICVLYLGTALPLPVRFPARAVRIENGTWLIQWPEMPAPLAEQWTQWLFRQHRRAIHTARDST